MKLAAISILSAVLAATPVSLHAQASDLPSAAPATPPGNSEQRGRTLLDEMVKALGGDAWLNRTSMQTEGRGSTFYHGQPNPYEVEYKDIRRFAASGKPDTERVGFLTPRGMILPGKRIDVVQIWTDKHGYEVTYKGKTDLPKDQVAEFYRNRAHSLEEVVHSWIHAPGVLIVDEGRTMVDRHIADKVSVLSATNDGVTLEIDATTHLPLRRTYQWRNPQFNDFDHEEETYDDYHTFDGIPTPMTITRYHNGDMVAQRFLTKVEYNVPTDDDTFNPEVVASKLSKVKK